MTLDGDERVEYQNMYVHVGAQACKNAYESNVILFACMNGVGEKWWTVMPRDISVPIHIKTRLICNTIPYVCPLFVECTLAK